MIDDIYVGYKIQLFPSEDQIRIFNMYFGATRFAYNFGLNLCEKMGESEGFKYKNIGWKRMSSEIVKLRKDENYQWLNSINLDVLRYGVKDLYNANQRYIDGQCKKPRYKVKDNSHQQFSVRRDKIRIYEDKILIPSTQYEYIGYVDCCNPFPELIGTGNKKVVDLDYIHYYNARVIFDGLNYYFTVSVKFNQVKNQVPNLTKSCALNKEWTQKDTSGEILGIDIGCGKDNWFVTSNGIRISQPDIRLERRKIRKLQKQMHRQRVINDRKYKEKLVDGDPSPKRRKTKREEKTYKEFRKYHSRIVNKREYIIHNLACTLVRLKPKAIVMETLCVDNMLIDSCNNKNVNEHNRNVLGACIYKSTRIIQQKAENNGIKFIKADRDYPSTQLCSNCGHRMDIGRKKIYRCPECGMIMDRDDNAAKNLSKFGEIKLSRITPFIYFEKDLIDSDYK